MALVASRFVTAYGCGSSVQASVIPRCARLFRPHCSRRSFMVSAKLCTDFTHVVVGGGAVGLAIARRLAQQPNTSTLLLEKHRAAGTETSSRNSEVIHAGLYYGYESLKTNLCLRGKRMLYELCEAYDIPHRNCGKWIVAQDEAQMSAVQRVHEFAESLGRNVAPTRFLSTREAKQREPDVCARAGVLESSSTGIVDSHAYMSFLEADFQAAGGDCAFGSTVTQIEPVRSGKGGWKLWTQDAAEEPVTTEVLINSAGLGAIALSNLIMSPERQKKQYYAKGSYYAYNSGSPRPKTLIYPAPVEGHGGLGTHLTLDMAGQIRFGPDTQWVDSPDDLSPNFDPGSLNAALSEITSYLPNLDRDAVRPDYSGIRPKLSPKSSATSGPDFEDFHIVKEKDFHGFVNLLGIESPGLTSSLAIAEHVHDLLYR